MRQHFHVSRRAMLAGSATALALTLPASVFAQARQPFPAMVRVAWGENESDSQLRSRLIAAVAQAMAESGADIRTTWVLAGA